MSDKHTQGRLTTSESTEHWGRTNAHINDADGNMLGSIWCGTTEQNKANARRLVACWNAAEGLSTESLESAGNAFNGWRLASYAMNDAKAQRDELLEALKAIVGIDVHSTLTEAEADAIHQQARAAIAKAEAK